MNFNDLLDLAKRNDDNNKVEAQVKRYSTHFIPPKKKKETPKSRALTANVRRFLAKKEEEEKQKAEDELRKKEKLMALRATDRKAQKRVKAMITRTKGFSKAVLEDAKEAADNQEVTMEAQPDEDDYGFVSENANDMYKKIMQKYVNVGDKVSMTGAKPHRNMSNTKDRVRDAINRAQEEDATHGRRKKKRQPELDDDRTDRPTPNSSQVSNSHSKKSRPPPKPALSYEELMNIASKKQKEPVPLQIEKPVNTDKEFEYDRPMTKKEKEEFLREQQAKLRRLGKLPPLASSTSTTSDVKSKLPAQPSQSNKVKDASTKSQQLPVKKPESSISSQATTKLPTGHQTDNMSAAQRSQIPQQSTSNKKPFKTSVEVPRSQQTAKTLQKPSGTNRPLDRRSSDNTLHMGGRPIGNNRPMMKRPANKGHEMERKSFGKMPQRPGYDPYRRPVESDSEEDSEMDDFIDDTPLEGNDVSAMIQQMFGYNRRKYVDDDEDDATMESSWQEQMKEEHRSAKLGILEDLEDMDREIQEKQKKKMRRK